MFSIIRMLSYGHFYSYFYYLCIFFFFFFFFFKQKTAYEIGLGIPAEPLFRSFFLISWFSLLLLQLLRHLFYRHLKLHRQRYILVSVKQEIGRAVQQECRDRSRMPSSA